MFFGDERGRASTTDECCAAALPSGLAGAGCDCGLQRRCSRGPPDADQARPLRLERFSGDPRDGRACGRLYSTERELRRGRQTRGSSNASIRFGPCLTCFGGARKGIGGRSRFAISYRGLRVGEGFGEGGGGVPASTRTFVPRGALLGALAGGATVPSRVISAAGAFC